MGIILAIVISDSAMPKKREISPAVNASADEYVSLLPPPLQGLISRIRAQKESDSRTRPSASLIDKSAMLTPEKRAALLDKVAELVDENVGGRSDMCLQFAGLLNLGLRHLGFNSFAVTGTATYLSAKGKRIHAWKHAWVRVGRELIDGNTDSIAENPVVPTRVSAAPYWGPIQDLPAQRLLEQDGFQVDDDPDVKGVWWPDLKDWLEKDFTGID
jgi:hypothetical protein